MKKLQDVGLTRNPEKYIFLKDSIPFWGLVLNHQGIKQDLSAISTIDQAESELGVTK